MVKLTIIGRIRDGMPLAQGLRYTNEKNSTLSYYKPQVEFILKELSNGSLQPNPKFTIRLDHQHSFNCLIHHGVCYITLCDSWYPRTLAFYYLEDLRLELDKFDQLIENISRPYSFVKFDSVISSTMRNYIDTRTQANLKKLNDKRGRELSVMTMNMSTLIENRRQIDYFEKVVMAPQVVSPIWNSPRLEVMALKWIPIGISISVIATVLLWAYLTMTDYIGLSSL